eukprot:g11138.t1
MLSKDLGAVHLVDDKYASHCSSVVKGVNDESVTLSTDQADNFVATGGGDPALISREGAGSKLRPRGRGKGLDATLTSGDGVYRPDLAGVGGVQAPTSRTGA